MAVDLAPVVAGARRVFCCHEATLTGRHARNSLEAVAECVAAGVPRLEVDVRFLADDGMLVFHDSWFDAMTDAEGAVSTFDTAATRRIRTTPHGSTLPLFEEVVDVIPHGQTLLQVDLKLTRWMTPERESRLAAALEPIRDRVLIGSMAHWNLRGLQARGFRVALDPTLQWHALPRRDPGGGIAPGRMGLHGLWDDAPLAHVPRVASAHYLASRVEDLLALLPAAEWMVDYQTLLHLRTMEFDLGHELAKRGVELAAWTIRDDGPDATKPLLAALFSLGTATVITDYAERLAEYARAL